MLAITRNYIPHGFYLYIYIISLIFIIFFYFFCFLIYVVFIRLKSSKAPLFLTTFYEKFQKLNCIQKIILILFTIFYCIPIRIRLSSTSLSNFLLCSFFILLIDGSPLFLMTVFVNFWWLLFVCNLQSFFLKLVLKTNLEFQKFYNDFFLSNLSSSNLYLILKNYLITFLINFIFYLELKRERLILNEILKDKQISYLRNLSSNEPFSVTEYLDIAVSQYSKEIFTFENGPVLFIYDDIFLNIISYCFNDTILPFLFHFYPTFCKYIPNFLFEIYF